MISSHLRTLIVLVLALLGIASFIYTQFLIERFVEKDRISIELWAKAIEYSSRELNTGIRENLDEVNREITALSQVSDAQKVSRRTTSHGKNTSRFQSAAGKTQIRTWYMSGNKSIRRQAAFSTRDRRQESNDLKDGQGNACERQTATGRQR